MSLRSRPALHIFAPDEGNIHLRWNRLPPRNRRGAWLRPLARGEHPLHSFCMTEAGTGGGIRPLQR